MFPKSFTDASLFVSEYTEAFKLCQEERPIMRGLQIFRLRMSTQISKKNLVQEMLKSFNLTQLRRENPRFVFDEQAAIESVLVYQIVKQLGSIGLQVESNLEGKFNFEQVAAEGPLNKHLLSNTQLQDETVSIVSSFFWNIQPQNVHQASGISDWEDIESNMGKLRTGIIDQVKKLFFEPFVEATCAKGEKHYFMKVHPRILISLMFAFKQKWLFEESGANENTNFKAMEKLLIDWVTIYNKSSNVYFVKDSKSFPID